MKAFLVAAAVGLAAAPPSAPAKPVRAAVQALPAGDYPGLAGMDPHARLGFSARGVLKRSDFGVKFGIPAPGTTLGVSDEVSIALECEFTGPALEAKVQN